MAVNFDADKSILSDCGSDIGQNLSSFIRGVYESKTIKTIGVICYDLCHFIISRRIIRVKWRKDHCTTDPNQSCTMKVRTQGGAGIPRARKTVPLTSMAVGINNNPHI